MHIRATYSPILDMNGNPTKVVKYAYDITESVLQEQKTDLSTAIDELMADFESGTKKMKVYKQMKMYNDADLNPVLYRAK